MSYHHRKGNFAGFDNTNLYFQSWINEGSKLHIVIAHGHGEHSGRYNHLIDYFENDSISFHALDHRGHGQSDGLRGHVDSWDDYIRDLDVFIDKVIRENNVKKVVLLGHSMGGHIGLNYAITDQSKLMGLIISAPAISLRMKVNPVKEIAGRVLSKIASRVSMSTQLDPEGISRDPNEVMIYKNDPLVHDRASTRWFSEFLKYSSRVYLHADVIQTPILIFMGEEDPIVDPEGIKKLYTGIKYSNKKLLLFNGLYHECMNELEDDRNEVFSQVKEWIVKNWLS